MKITIENLCEKLSQKLELQSCMDFFYIGKTSDKEDTIKRHEGEYSSTTFLAQGSFTDVSIAEKKVIDYFEKTKMCSKLNNKVTGSPGRISNNSKYYIYVSIHIKPWNENELFDDDLEWDDIYELDV